MEMVEKDLDIKQIRQINLKKIVDFEKKIGKGVNKRIGDKAETDPNYISQILSEKAPATLGDIIARRLEAAYGLELGWFDSLDNSPIPEKNYPKTARTRNDSINQKALEGAIHAIEEYCRGNCINTTPEKKTKAIIILYEMLLADENAKFNKSLVNALIEML